MGHMGDRGEPESTGPVKGVDAAWLQPKAAIQDASPVSAGLLASQEEPYVQSFKRNLLSFKCWYLITFKQCSGPTKSMWMVHMMPVLETLRELWNGHVPPPQETSRREKYVIILELLINQLIKNIKLY